MFYDTDKRDHGLPHDPLKAIVAPRPIGWISSISASGKVNLAPYSYFNAISNKPDMLMFSSAGVKDSVRNIRETKEFVANYASADLAREVNLSSVAAPHGQNEFELTGIEQAPSRLVKPPRVAAAHAALECVLVEEIQLKDRHGNAVDQYMIIGEIVGIHIDDAVVRNGRFDVTLAEPLTRLGYMDFQRPQEYFEMFRPDWDDEAGEIVER